MDTIRSLQNEIERLQHELADLNTGWQGTYDHDTNLLKTEIDRLRQCERHEYAEAKEETERLRDLLSEALDSEISDYWYVRVREALGHE